MLSKNYEKMLEKCFFIYNGYNKIIVIGTDSWVVFKLNELNNKIIKLIK